MTKLSTELSEAREKLRRAESRSGTSSDEEDTNKDKRERPSEDVVERMEEKLEAAQSDQKNLFLIIFQVETFLFVQKIVYLFFSLDKAEKDLSKTAPCGIRIILLR